MKDGSDRGGLAPDFTGGNAIPIRHYLKDDAVFDPDAIEAMSDALERACQALNVKGELRDRQIIAVRIIDLARNGTVDAGALSDRAIREMEALRSL